MFAIEYTQLVTGQGLQGVALQLETHSHLAFIPGSIQRCIMCSLCLLHALVERCHPSLNILLGPDSVHLCPVPAHAFHAVLGLTHCALNAGNQTLQYAADVALPGCKCVYSILRMPCIYAITS